MAEQNRLKILLDKLTVEKQNLTRQYNELVNNYNSLVSHYHNVVVQLQRYQQHNEDTHYHKELSPDNATLQARIKLLETQYSELQRNYDDKAKRVTELLAELSTYRRDRTSSSSSDDPQKMYLLAQDFKYFKTNSLQSVSSQVFDYTVTLGTSIISQRKQQMAQIKAILTTTILQQENDRRVLGYKREGVIEVLKAIHDLALSSEIKVAAQLLLKRGFQDLQSTVKQLQGYHPVPSEMQADIVQKNLNAELSELEDNSEILPSQTGLTELADKQNEDKVPLSEYEQAGHIRNDCFPDQSTFAKAPKTDSDSSSIKENMYNSMNHIDLEKQGEKDVAVGLVNVPSEKREQNGDLEPSDDTSIVHTAEEQIAQDELLSAEENLQQLIEKSNHAICVALGFLEPDLLPSEVRRSLRQLIEDGFTLVEKIHSTDPPGILWSEPKGTFFDKHKHEVIRGFKDEGQIQLTVCPGYQVNEKIFVKVDVLTEPE